MTWFFSPALMLSLGEKMLQFNTYFSTNQNQECVNVACYKKGMLHLNSVGRLKMEQSSVFTARITPKQNPFPSFQ